MRKFVFEKIVLSILTAACLSQVVVAIADTEHNDMVGVIPEQVIWPGRGASYYKYNPHDGTHRHLIVVDRKGRKKDQPEKWQIKPIVGDKIATTSSIAQNENVSAAINAGYFNLSDGVSASYIVIDGKEIANPRTNRALIENPKLQPYLEKIFNRSEIRILQDNKGKTHYDISCHNDPIAKNCKLIHSLQAGPQLLPKLTLEEEAFVRKDLEGNPVDAIGANKKAARTAFGITKEGDLILFAVAGKGQDPESSGITMEELRVEMKTHGCVKAINLDGGASTTMFARLMPTNKANKNVAPRGSVVCGKNPETSVKSILALIYLLTNERP